MQSRSAGKMPGRLHGVVIGIKDVICYKEHPVTAGSHILEGFHSLYNATVVEQTGKGGCHYYWPPQL